MPMDLSGRKTLLSRKRVILPILVTFTLVCITDASSQTNTLFDVTQIAQASVKDGVKSQKVINKYDDKTTELVGEYRAALIQLEALREYNDQLEKLIRAQKVEMISIRQQIKDVTTIDRSIIPHMFRMIDGLEAFVELDTPFLITERRARVQRLRDLMDRSDANPAEKYRKILEAFEIENEYGRTIEAYEGKLTVDGKAKTVNFLRLGRVTWLYQSLDKDESAVWSQDERDWVDLEGDFDSEINTAIRIAKEQTAPNLLTIPVFSLKGGN